MLAQKKKKKKKCDYFCHFYQCGCLTCVKAKPNFKQLNIVEISDTPKHLSHFFHREIHKTQVLGED